MDDSQKAQEPQTPRDPSTKTRFLPVGRLSTAVAGAVALVALSVGVALAATSGDDSGPRHGVTNTVPPDADSAGTSGGGTDGGSSSGDDGGGTVSGSGGTDGGGGSVGTTGGADPSPTSTSPDDPGPSGEPSPPVDLNELDRRITELDKKVDRLPTKKELADALRAFADQLDKSEASGQPDPS
ncbi:hypothetical protein [Streptomyces sp. NPDC020362]|uniref:hypothetical protein n=1 Tax=unclassified Streptomyces TaxID=2593676 RepID=UPI0033C914BD